MIPAQGAVALPAGRCRFRVWAPAADRVALHLLSPRDEHVPLSIGDDGYREAIVDDVSPGARYRYVLDDSACADPASRFQPDGVHGPSEVVDPTRFVWTDEAWQNPPLEQHVLYEVHVGTFSPAGTFDGIVEHLAALRDLGITAIELMPVAQFPGERNWGYDGVFPSAVQHSYGGPAGLARLVDACHAHGLAVFLDVVYNHLGPEGNALARFGPYFTDRYETPWGAAMNVDGPGSDEVRRFFIDSALGWVRDYHLDGLRLDAIHGIIDPTPVPFLQELASEVHTLADALGRRVLVIAENETNDARVVAPPERGGLGMDAMWSDDLHHAVHAVLTGERDGYYVDYGSLPQLGRAITEGFAFQGERSRYRGRRHGGPAAGVPARAHVVCVQNHDQVGNRLHGERLASLVPAEDLALAAGLLLLSPHVPLLFMGEEYGETAPFLYFVDHSEPALIDAVRRGRRDEFAAFGWEDEPPDSQDEKTFLRSRLDRTLRTAVEHRRIEEVYGALVRLRRDLPALARLNDRCVRVDVEEERELVTVFRWTETDEALIAYAFARDTTLVPLPAGGGWEVAFASATETDTLDPEEGVVGVPPRSFVLLHRRKP